MDELEREAGGKVMGRPHIAAILLRKGYVSSIKQAFDKYLAPGGSAYFDKERLTPKNAISMILESGGLPVLAHPIQLRYHNDAELERLVKDLLDLGLAGIEVIHSDHGPELVEKYTALANRYGLLKTGGSDFHGSNKTHSTGHRQRPPHSAGLLRRVDRAVAGELREKGSSLIIKYCPLFPFASFAPSRLIPSYREGAKDGEENNMPMKIKPINPVGQEIDAETLNAAFERKSPQQIVQWAVAEFGRRPGHVLVLRRRFAGAASTWRFRPCRQSASFFATPATCFPETHRYMEELRQRLNLNVWTYRTRHDPIAFLHQAGEDNPAWRKDIDGCCAANKTEPFERAMKELSPAAWLRGIRRHQSDSRRTPVSSNATAIHDTWAISPLLAMDSPRDGRLCCRAPSSPSSTACAGLFIHRLQSACRCTRAVRPGEDPALRSLGRPGQNRMRHQSRLARCRQSDLKNFRSAGCAKKIRK